MKETDCRIKNCRKARHYCIISFTIHTQNYLFDVPGKVDFKFKEKISCYFCADVEKTIFSFLKQKMVPNLKNYLYNKVQMLYKSI